MGGNDMYNWWSARDYYSGDANTTFDIALLKDDMGNDFSGGENRGIVLNGIRYRLNTSKTAEVLKNDYSGEIVIPETVTYNNITYKVTSLGKSCFKGCSNLTSINLPSSIISLGYGCFYNCTLQGFITRTPLIRPITPFVVLKITIAFACIFQSPLITTACFFIRSQ